MNRHLDRDNLVFTIWCLVALLYMIFVVYPIGYWVCVHILGVPNPVYQMDDTPSNSRFLIWSAGLITSLIPCAIYLLFNWIFPKHRIDK